VIEQVKLIEFRENTNSQGKLVAIEGSKDIPFDIKRVFYIYGASRYAVRGCHANKQSEFVLINVCGSSKVKVKSNQFERVYIMDKPYIGLYLPKMIWKEMYDFSPDSLLLVLASEYYDKSEYINDFEDYIRNDA